jgi:phosphonate transport system ATP-binding protein
MPVPIDTQALRTAQAPAIRLDRVTKRFSTTVLGLDDVTLEIPAGQRVVLLGKSGSGKSTLLRHVNRLQEPTTGTVHVHGLEIGSLRRAQVRALRRSMGFVFQDFFLVGSISALENVCTGMLGTLRGPRMGLSTYPKPVRRQALELLDRVGIADRAFQRTDTLSGGQQQRVAIARALVQQPTVLCADEPVASLDPEASAGVLDLITRISIEDHLTVLMSLHQVEYALGFAERIVGLREGRVVFDEKSAHLGRDQVMGIYSQTGIAADPEAARVASSVGRSPSSAPASIVAAAGLVVAEAGRR